MRSEYHKRLSKTRDRISQLRGKYNLLKDQIATDTDKIEIYTQDRETIQKAIWVFEYLIKQKYDDVIELFEATVSSALQDLFTDTYEFKFELGRRGDSTTCDFSIHTGEYPGYQNLQYSQGKSIQEIIACILRIVIVKLQPLMPDFVLLDEPFGGLEPERQILAGEFLKKICDEFKLQTITVTQSPEFAQASDNVIEL